MTDTVRQHLRAALDEIVKAEKDRLSNFYEETDQRIAGGIKKLRPVIEALVVLRAEVGSVEGVEIHPAEHGHMATVNLKSNSSSTHLTINTGHDNTAFRVERSVYYSFEPETFTETRTFHSPEEVLQLVLKDVGEHIASRETVAALPKEGWKKHL